MTLRAAGGSLTLKSGCSPADSRDQAGFDGLSVIGATAPRLACTFCDVRLAIDHLKVWQTPKPEQLRPREIAVFVPDAKQRESVINFGIPPEPFAGLAAATRLEAA